jgi:hypothetical protein
LLLKTIKAPCDLFTGAFPGALNAIVLANIVGFGCVAISDVWGGFSGGSRPVAKGFLVIHVLLTVAFVVAWQTRLRLREHRTAR